MAIFSGMGVAIGAGIGAATSNMGFWIGMGLPIGCGIGSAIGPGIFLSKNKNIKKIK